MVAHQPVGRGKMASRRGGSANEGGRTGTGQKNAEPFAGSAMGFGGMEGYAAAAAFWVRLGAGLGAAFFVSLALSFAANSCLTFAVIAATSTL